MVSSSSDDNAVHDDGQLSDAEDVPRSGDEISINEGSDEDKDDDCFDADTHSLTPS